MESIYIDLQYVLNDKDYPYEYIKIIEFIEGKPEMVISYKLKNTGKQTIETQVFNHNFFVFDNQPINTGTGFRIKGNQPLSKMVFWCNAKTICPEPYIKIKIEPGEEFSWKNTYEFYSE
jgi:hypothetical protein